MINASSEKIFGIGEALIYFSLRISESAVLCKTCNFLIFLVTLEVEAVILAGILMGTAKAIFGAALGGIFSLKMLKASE